MKRAASMFVVLTVLSMLVVSGCGKKETTESGETVINLIYANFPPAGTFPCVQMEEWKTKVEKQTKGRIKVATKPGGQLLGATDMFDGVVSGVADIGCVAMGYQPGVFPVSEALDLPVMFPNARVSSMALYDIIMKYKPEEFAKVKIIALFTCPPSSIMSSKPVRALADLEGLKLRVAGSAVGVLKNLGGSPEAMPQSQTPEALQTGRVQGLVSSFDVLKDFKYAETCKFATEVNLQVVSFAVVMNKKKWESLPDDVKKVIDDLVREQSLWTGQYVDDHAKEALEWSKKEQNVELIQLSEEEQAKIPELVKPLIDSYIEKVKEKDIPGDKIVEDIFALKEKYAQEYK